MNANGQLRWLDSYPDPLRWDVELPTGPVWTLLEQAVTQYPDHPALNFLGHRLNYRQLNELVNRAACGFQRLGVKPGVHVGLYLPNTPHYVIAFMGVLRAGGTVVNYSPLDAERTLAHKIEDSETALMVTLDLAALYPKMAGLCANSRLQTLIVGHFTEFAPDASAEQANLLGPATEVAFGEHCRSFASLLDNDGDYTAYPLDDAATALAVLQYTGGTTGAPKGAMLTHANITASCSQLQAILDESLRPGEERVLAVLPPFHIYALMINMLFSLRMAAEVYLHPRFDAETVLREIHDNRITTFPGVPTMFIGLLAHPLTAQLDLTSLKLCNSGGAPLPLEVQQRYSQMAGCALREGWGMTETTTTGTFTPRDATPRPGSCGIPVPGAQIRIAPLDGAPGSLPPGERGEVCIAGANVTAGYWKRPEATAEAMTADGFLRTGDVGYMDEEGWLYIVDRTKDMILCSGYNVYPRVIEEAIYEHPAVEEVSVIGIDDAYRGQAPKAFIKLKAGADPFDFAQLQAFLESRLGKHERLAAMEIRAALPRTPVGKLSKKELVEEEQQKRHRAIA
ncbi:long-chain-fatty-acid--CoA ligase [Pseudomonas saudimassiliensis]|uniref:Long-chain-fatty-acid--CoA ligase n=1 Tax=Pseudomonas saudimassiliensis TaxID=1461581 RepID=A0A078MDD2_9PSED|nr:long-chain fatty acid--CoA ligase [Pseudomonas saudimassiliensis]CEA04214.1 long-chain-fatty-acid--CoA ligase [Pseudomonas saudimassiliensis]CEF26477.1 long-chain-fatty-acid--CoA ligase [Pseudomonas saudimassiliensis]